MRRVVHDKHDTGHDLQREAESQDDAQIHIQFWFLGVGIMMVS